MNALSEEKLRLSIDRHFFFASILGHLEIIEDPGIPTACTNGESIRYNPKWWGKLPFKERCGVLCHEVLHVAMRHAERARGYEHDRANMAMDYAINPLVPYPLPTGHLRDEDFDGKTWEWIYDHLPPGNKCSGNGMGKDNDPGGCGAVVPGTGNGDARMRQHVAAASAIAQQMGRMPANMARALGLSNSNRVPWEAHLDKFLHELLESKYDWCYPEEDHVFHGVFVPKLTQEPKVGYLVFAIDTSGSIDDKALSRFASEVMAACAAYQPARVRIMFADAEVAADYDESQDDLERILRKPKGGGGTDFRPVFRKLRDDQPDGLVYLTDLYGTFPDRAPEYPVLWVTDMKQEDPPWGEKITMS